MNWQTGEQPAQPDSPDFVGRDVELSTLETLLEPDSPRVMYVHGIAGIGKTSLLDIFTSRARRAGATILRFDCRTMEPTPAGFFRELGDAIGTEVSDFSDAIPRLGDLGSRTILVLDTYEVYRLMDTWLRREMVPVLPPNVRLLCGGRERPVAAWYTLPERPKLFRSLAMEPLREPEAIELLTRQGLPDKAATRIAQVTHGHPLALQLAAAAHSERPNLAFDETLSLQQALDELTRMFLADVKDPLTRRTLEAASVIRRTTLSLLRAMLPDLAPRDAYERLRSLPFVNMADDGLLIHDAVREALAHSLRATDPDSFLMFRQAAWQQLLRENQKAGRWELWRYTADMLYLIENPVVREAFFPRGTQTLVVEPATPDDKETVCRLIETWEQPQAAKSLLLWWRRAPETFVVARGSQGEVAGLCCKFISHQVPAGWLKEDPITNEWYGHLQTSPLPEGQQALFCRRWLSAEHGEAPSDIQAALWLDLKRTYLELRPALRRVYLTVEDIDAYGPVATRLGFTVLSEHTLVLDSARFTTAMLDFGPQSVDGWLANLAASELGIGEHSLLDPEAQQLVIDGGRVDLTPLEFGVMQYLSHRTGKAVPREDLLKDVWGTNYFGGSNVVDTVVRGLRRKMGPYAKHIETVTGVGYRFRSH